MANLQYDLELAFSLLNEKDSVNTYKLYPWSNERIFKYYKYYDLTEKKALCITGSGDHALYAIAAGAKEIDCVDKNFLCKYYQALKIALIIAYDEKTFFSHFNNSRRMLLTNKIELNDIKEFMEDEIFIFWNELINSRVFKKNKRLFRTDGFPTKFSLDYKELKEKLSTAKVKYYDSDFKEFIKDKDNEYDVIFLSNLLEWQSPFRDIILFDCLNSLKENGVLYDTFIKRDFVHEMPFKGFEKKITTEFGFPGLHFSEKGIYVYRKKELIIISFFI